MIYHFICDDQFKEKILGVELNLLKPGLNTNILFQPEIDYLQFDKKNVNE